VSREWAISPLPTILVSQCQNCIKRNVIWSIHGSSRSPTHFSPALRQFNPPSSSTTHQHGSARSLPGPLHIPNEPPRRSWVRLLTWLDSPLTVPSSQTPTSLWTGKPHYLTPLLGKQSKEKALTVGHDKTGDHRGESGSEFVRAGTDESVVNERFRWIILWQARRLGECSHSVCRISRDE